MAIADLERLTRIVGSPGGDRSISLHLNSLQEFRTELGLKVYAYCLMTNHVHLIIDLGGDSTNLGLLMKRLAGGHTRRYTRNLQSKI